MKKILIFVQILAGIAVVFWLLMIAQNFAYGQTPGSCVDSSGRIENMTIVLDHLAFPPSETPRSVEAIGADGECYGSTIMEPGQNTALAVWGSDDFVSGGMETGDRLNISLEYFPDAIIAITTAARDTTLSEVISTLELQVARLQAERDSLQGLVDTFPDQSAEIAQLTRSLAISDSLNLGFAGEIATALGRLTALSNSIGN